MTTIGSNLKWSILILSCIIVSSCSNRNVNFIDQQNRLLSYLESEDHSIASLFSDENRKDLFQTTLLTQTELSILDGLVEHIRPEIRREFDQKYMAWLKTWTHGDLFDGSISETLKCNQKPYQELMDFCLQQNDDIFLLFYQLAARANCPFDQYLLYPTHDLYSKFPEFGEYWSGVNNSLKKEKPHSVNRTCNESTIWCTRKILETKYGFTYASMLTSLFDTRKLLLMTQ